MAEQTAEFGFVFAYERSLGEGVRGLGPNFECFRVTASAPFGAHISGLFGSNREGSRQKEERDEKAEPAIWPLHKPASTLWAEEMA